VFPPHVPRARRPGWRTIFEKGGRDPSRKRPSLASPSTWHPKEGTGRGRGRPYLQAAAVGTGGPNVGGAGVSWAAGHLREQRVHARSRRGPERRRKREIEFLAFFFFFSVLLFLCDVTNRSTMSAAKKRRTAGGTGLRIFTGGLLTETCTFSPIPSCQSDWVSEGHGSWCFRHARVHVSPSCRSLSLALSLSFSRLFKEPQWPSARVEHGY